MATKPKNLIYGLDDKPPILTNIFLGIQHYWIIAIAFVFPVILVRSINGSYEMQQHVLSMSMIASAIGVIVQSLKNSKFGSGFLLPSVNSPSYMAASLIAIKAGGLPLLFGMTIFAGFFEAFLSRFLHKLKVLFPPEVTGLIVTMVGISVIKIGAMNFFSINSNVNVSHHLELLAAVITLSIMIGINVWSKGRFKLFAVLIGIVFGYIICFAFGILNQSHIDLFNRTKLFEISFNHSGWAFSWDLVLPFVIASMCSTTKSIGDIMTCQKINDSKWKQTDMKNVKGGILADSIGSIAGGLFGGMGQSTSSSNLGLSISNGATSRVIAYSIAGILMITAFFPKFAFIFTTMPQPVIGATLFFAISFMILAGVQIMISRMLDTRKIFVIGLSMIIGISMIALPDSYIKLMPAVIQPIFSNSLTSSAIIAIILNLIFRIGIVKKYSLVLNPQMDSNQKIFDFMHDTGSKTAALKESVDKAKHALNELFNAIKSLDTTDEITCNIHYSDNSVDIVLKYKGVALEDIKHPPDIRKMEANEKELVDLSIFIARRYVNNIEFSTENDLNIIKINVES